MNYEEGDVVIGTVDKLIGTSVFVKLDSKTDGVMTFSEVAPGRIRNIRDYVNPGQKIVVKILRIDEEKRNIDLSLRRVTKKEKKEILENEKKEKELITILKLVTKNEEKAKEVFEKIKESIKISQFFEQFLARGEKENIDFFKSFGLKKEEAENLFLMLKDKIKEKKVMAKTEFALYSNAENGIEKIKKVLSFDKNIQIKYLGAPNYSILVEDKNYKESNKKMLLVLEELNKRAKAESCFFCIKQNK